MAKKDRNGTRILFLVLRSGSMPTSVRCTDTMIPNNAVIDLLRLINARPFLSMIRRTRS